MKRYTEKFQVRTAGGRLVGSACSIECAERMASGGRRRWIYEWYEGRYRCFRPAYGSSAKA